MSGNSGITPIERWPVVQLRHLFAVVSGATPDSNEPDYWDGDILWVTPEDIGSLETRCLLDTRRKITAKGYENCGAKIVPAGSLVLTKRAPIGQLAILKNEACSNQGCLLLTAKQQLDSRFFYYLLFANADWLQALGRGSTFMELSTDDVKSFRISLPLLAEQQTIADMLDQETARLDTLLAEKEHLLALLSEKRRALITRAVTQGLEPHTPMRDSGLQWLGEIPEHWRTERSKWLFCERDERTQTGEGELLTVSHITGVTPRSEKDVNMFEAETTEGYKICRRGDLAINTMWAWMGAMGVSPVDGIVSPSYNVYTPCEKLLGSYVDALVRTPQFVEEVTRYSKGVWSSRLRLYPEEFFLVWLPVPPLEEQEAIITHIDTEIGKIDALRGEASRTIALLKERRAALIAAAVTGQLAVGAET